jgi:hypothetical protein
MSLRHLSLPVLAIVCLTPVAVPCAKSAEAQRKEPSAANQLAIQQGIVADKYAKLEKLLDDMARIEGVSNPRRAALLMQALKQSKDNLTAVKLNTIVQLLNQEQLKRALENQEDAKKDLAALLELLLSENRADRLKSEQERIREYIKEVDRILRLQKGVQGRWRARTGSRQGPRQRRRPHRPVGQTHQGQRRRRIGLRQQQETRRKPQRLGQQGPRRQPVWRRPEEGRQQGRRPG